jgi:competence protein ComEC
MVEIFHRVTFAGVGLNAAAIPVMTVLLALALPINLLSVASPVLAAGPAKILSLVMALLFEMTHLPGMASWLSYRMPAPPVWVAWGFCAAFVLAGCALRFAPRWVGVTFVTCAIFVGLVAVDPFGPRLPLDAMEVTALDCGQGEALFLVLPGGATMLVNAGGGPTWGTHRDGAQSRRWNAGEEIVSPYLWSRGIKRIDVVALTRTSPDNLAGLQAVLENFEVGEFWHPPTAETPDYGNLLDDMARRRIPMRALEARYRFSLNGASFHMFSPNADGGSTGSMALEISADGMDFVLAGGAGLEAENRIVIAEPSIESEAIGVAYHGVNPPAIQGPAAPAMPRVEILGSSGLIEGREGTLDAKPSAGTQIDRARIFHTAIDGATTVEWKDGSLVVRTYKNPEGVAIASETRGPALSRDNRNGR